MQSDPDTGSAYSVRSTLAGCLVIDSKGKIAWRGELSRLPGVYQNHRRVDYGNKWILPGFVDAHIHFPQYRMLASHGANLLDWLTRFTFPEEMAFESEQVAEAAAITFLNHLFRAGTTSCLCFATSHVVSVQAIFRAAADRNMALITGKTMMDRGAPDALLDGSSDYIADCRSLIDAWHGRQRLRYAISPRFAITSSDLQLQLCGQLASDFLASSFRRIFQRVWPKSRPLKRLFPLGQELHRGLPSIWFSKAGGPVRARNPFVRGRKIAAIGPRGWGCSLPNLHYVSWFRTLSLACQSNKAFVSHRSRFRHWSRHQLFHAPKHERGLLHFAVGRWSVACRELFGTATLGNAQLLGIDGDVGTLDVGKFADFIVIDPLATELLRDRSPLSQDVMDQLFSFAHSGR